MNARASQIAFVVALIILSGCVSTSHDSRWRIAKEDSFTVEIPTWLRKRKIQPVDSNCGQYGSPRMRLNFDEVSFLLYPPEKAKALHEKFAGAYQTSAQDETRPEFIKRVGERYAHFTVGRDKKWVEWGYPGEYAVEVHIPDLRGGYLSLYVTYCDPADTDTALHIAKSIKFKK